MSKHTPGPWVLVETPHEKIISSWHIKVGEHQIQIHPYKRIWSKDRTQSGLVTDAQHMADARLIAAAPDLLDAALSLKNRGFFTAVSCADEATLADMANMIAAITKATGEAA